MQAIHAIVFLPLIAALVDIPIFARLTVADGSQLEAALVLVEFLVALPVGALAGGYLVRRLPPGPIANPGAEALRAVAEPAATDSLYFVSRNDGTHAFSRSYAEHVGKVRRYQLRGEVGDGRQQRGRSQGADGRQQQSRGEAGDGQQQQSRGEVGDGQQQRTP